MAEQHEAREKELAKIPGYTAWKQAEERRVQQRREEKKRQQKEKVAQGNERRELRGLRTKARREPIDDDPTDHESTDDEPLCSW